MTGMELIFLGTGGGRINLLKQFRKTGGFRINSDSANIHVDPGPGALTQSLKHKQNPLKIDAVIVTHDHIDHCNDANLMIEGMSQHALKKRGILISTKGAIDGNSEGDRAINKYHQSKVSEVYKAKEGEKKKFKTKNGEFEIEILKVKHDAEEGFGFKLFIDGKVIGYTSDTEPYEGIEEDYSGCDFLIINCLKPAADKYKGHMTSNDVAKLIKKAKPKLAVITHLGMGFIRKGANKEAKQITKKSGVECLAAYDGLKL